MSINVTVSGNPISIKKGKMVTADPNHAKKEFHKRRLLRLEQVRQQSKDIAEDVRNKVRKEKKKQEYEIEEEGRQKMKNWQTRKLLDLQTQYKEALQELGAGHKEAEALVDEAEVMAERKEQNDKLASDRGRLAASKLQIERNKVNFKKSIPIQQKKLVRDIENTRAAFVSNIKKKKTTIGKSNKKKRKKASADINITIPESDSGSEEFEESSEEETSENKLSKTAEALQNSFSSYTEDSENLPTSLNSKDSGLNVHKQDSMDQCIPPGPKPSLNMESRIGRSTGEVLYDESRHEKSRNDIHALDTRISDRIKRRDIMASQPDYCDVVAETNPSPFIKSNTNIREAIESRYINQGPYHTNNMCTCGKSRDNCFLSCNRELKESAPSNRCTCGRNQGSCCLLCGQEAKGSGPSNTCTCRKIPSKCSCGQRLEESSLGNMYTYEKNEIKGSPSSGQLLKENGPGNTYTHEKNQKKSSLSSSQRPRERKQSASMPHRKSRESNVGEEIPTKPPVKLKDLRDRDIQPSKTTLDSSDSHKVQYYDHANRFSQDKLSNSHVEKITTHSIEVLPNVTSEAEWYEKMRQRDREAQMRGKRALEKERVYKDYEDIVTKLPLLQKKERIKEINKDKPEFHMTGDRLKERERKKQNQLDNAYTKLFPNLKPALITLPRNKQDAETKIAPDDDEATQSLNVAKWDVDHEEPKMFTMDEVQDIIKTFTGQKPKDRRVKLKELLGDLKLQKEQLLNEIQCLPRDESINELINDLNSVSDSYRPRKTDRMCNRKRSHEENEKETSPDITTESSSSVSDLKPHRRRKSRLTRGRYRGEKGKTPSPRKKAKMKSKRSVLILQNTSTQTTPKIVDASTSPPQDKPKVSEDLQKGSKAEPSVGICGKIHVPCDCNKENINSAEELCQIVIKLNDNEEPEVVVKAKEKEHQILDKTSKTKQRSPNVKKIGKKIESKSIAIGTDEITTVNVGETFEDKRKSSKASLPNLIEQSEKKMRSSKMYKGETKRDQPPPKERSDPKTKSWREQLSKNSMSSTSTSYLSPPNFQAAIDQTLGSHVEMTRRSFYDLHKKPQQGNLYDLSCLSVSQSQSPMGERTIDPFLLAHIKKLLSMSRDSVENLTGSTSNVQTPSQSVVEIDSNNPLAQLHNLIKYFNLKAEDIAQELSYSPDASAIFYNSSSSTSEKSVRQRRAGQESKGKHGMVDSPKSDLSDKQSSTHTVKSTQSLLAQYTNVTDSCSKRIANLASMIQQIREEKIEMLQHPPGSEMDNKSGVSQASSEQDVSTGYLDLPTSRGGSKHSSMNSTDDEDIQKRLLEIDLILANKLRKFTPLGENPIREENESRKDAAGPFEVSGPSKEVSDEATNELWMRLKRLTQPDRLQIPAATIENSSRDDNQKFISFLSDIPNLPKLEAQPEEKFDSYHRHPPPSKGLIIAKKFNDNISLVPHELSTIAEADSQISTKISSTGVSPNSSRLSLTVSPRKSFELSMRPETLSSNKSSKSSSDKSPVSSLHVRGTEMDLIKTSKSGLLSHSISVDTSSKSKGSSDLSLSKSMATVSKKSFLLSSSSSDDLESIETMLKSIGMEWAIPTLHKTNEALALASSSSSQDVSGKIKSKGNDTTGSEISLKNFLRKQMINKVSSSSLTSEASPVSLSIEFSDMSAIQFNSTDKNGKRTSTPIPSSNSKSKSSLIPVVFSNTSDISSVNANDHQSFHSLSEGSHSKNG